MLERVISLGGSIDRKIGEQTDLADLVAMEISAMDTAIEEVSRSRGDTWAPTTTITNIQYYLDCLFYTTQTEALKTNFLVFFRVVKIPFFFFQIFLCRYFLFTILNNFFIL